MATSQTPKATISVFSAGANKTYTENQEQCQDKD